MKRSLILLLTLVFCIGMLSSCSRRCKGGGWYGNRNLGYAPQQNKTDEAADLASIYTTEEECEETAD